MIICKHDILYISTINSHPLTLKSLYIEWPQWNAMVAAFEQLLYQVIKRITT